MPENQTAWNSDNQGIKEKINQNNQRGKAVDSASGLRKTAAIQGTGQVGLAVARWWAAWVGLA